MFRYLFAGVLLLHGLIHLLGFLSPWSLAVVPQLTGKSLVPLSEAMSKGMGILWLLTGLSFLVATGSYLLRRDGWLLITFGSAVLSQAVIMLYWPDAKAGTLVNVLIMIAVGLAYANQRFDRQADQEARQLLSKPTLNAGIVTPAMLTALPTPVRQWLLASGAVGKERVHTARLRQHGRMRTRPDGGWMPTEAEQYFNFDEPGFVWKADVKLLPFLPLAGRDRYANGRGNLLIKALSVVPVVDAADAKIDQGTLLRFLGELCWFPSAALSPYITWRAVDDARAEATMTYRGVSAKALFAFDARHRLVSVTADRYKGGGESGRLERWYIPARAWKAMHGVIIPVKGDGIWRLPTGDFTYYQWEITDIAYNKPILY